MKKGTKKIGILVCFILGLFNVFCQVGIGTTEPDSSSVLDVTSQSSGLLIPRLNTLERDAISEPANGLMIYNVDKLCLEINFGTKQVVNWRCAGQFNSASAFADCTNSQFNGTYINGVPLVASHTFQVRIVNHSLNSVGINFSTTDLTLSGVGGISVNSVSPASATIPTGGSQIVEYELTGTPGSSGELTGFWTIAGLMCIKTVPVVNGNATFNLPQTISVVSILDGTPVVDIQGIVDNGGNQLVFNVPYTSGIGTYEAYSGVYTMNNPGTGEGGDANHFRLSYPSGTFSTSGNIIVTIEVDGDGTFDAEKQLFGNQETIALLDFQVNGISKGNIHLQVISGIPDRNFTDPDHKFIYLPVLANDGSIWLNNNLGADYSNMNHPDFNPTQQATAYNDYHAYGSLYQWGRYSDGHELVNWNSSTTGSGTNGTTSDNASSDTPLNELFITENTSPFDWRLPQNGNLWQGETGVNNPCPLGYRLPTDAEMDNLLLMEGITNVSSAASSTLKITGVGIRRGTNGILNYQETNGNLWTSTVVGINSISKNIFSATGDNHTTRSTGQTVRCIKD